MGYDTWMKLNIEGESDGLDTAEVVKVLVEIAGDEAGIWEELMDSGAEMRWYDHSEDMQKLSLRFPGVVFALHGDGEESGDLWVEYHHNGRAQIEQQPEWSPPPFEHDKLVIPEKAEE